MHGETPEATAGGGEEGTRRKTRRIATTVGIVMAVAWGLSLVDQGLYDGIPVIPWESFDTAYAPEYYEAGFRAIRHGMTEDQVTCIIGLPLSQRTTSTGDTIWYYSRPAGDGSYLIRNLVFRDRRVARITHEREYD